MYYMLAMKDGVMQVTQKGAHCGIAKANSASSIIESKVVSIKAGKCIACVVLWYRGRVNESRCRLVPYNLSRLIELHCQAPLYAHAFAMS